MQLSIFFFLPSTDGALVVTLSTERVGGLKCVFGIIWLLRNQVLLAFVPAPLQALVGSMKFIDHLVALQPSVPLHFSPYAFAGVGGLKWTRTIDLTLIRRVL